MIIEFCKWGNSLAVRIPKALADAVKASDGKLRWILGWIMPPVSPLRRCTPGSPGHNTAEIADLDVHIADRRHSQRFGACS